MRRLARLAALGVFTVGAAFVAPATATGAGSSHAVVNIGGANHAISFNGSISGLSALQMVVSVETIGYGGQGTAVCRINGVGNPPVPGQCLGEQNGGKYWSYWRAAPGAGGFSYSHSGAGATTVTDGWVEGWAFGTGSPPGNFCPVSACAPPPPPPATAPPAPLAANTGASSSGGSGGPAATGGSSSTPATVPDGTPVTTSTTPSGQRGDGSKTGDGDQASSAKSATSGSSGTGDGDTGTPLGIGIAAALVVGAVATSTVLRRRRAGAAGDRG